MQHESRDASEAGERAGTSEAERRERLTRLVLCRSKLSPDEAALLRDVFPKIVAAHYDQVWNLLLRCGLDSHEAEDLLQEVFLALHRYLLEKGFVDNLPGMLHSFTRGQFLNHVRTRRRSPLSIGVPSSRSEKPKSQGISAGGSGRQRSQRRGRPRWPRGGGPRDPRGSTSGPAGVDLELLVGLFRGSAREYGWPDPVLQDPRQPFGAPPEGPAEKRSALSAARRPAHKAGAGVGTAAAPWAGASRAHRDRLERVRQSRDRTAGCPEEPRRDLPDPCEPPRKTPSRRRCRFRPQEGQPPDPPGPCQPPGAPPSGSPATSGRSDLPPVRGDGGLRAAEKTPVLDSRTLSSRRE